MARVRKAADSEQAQAAKPVKKKKRWGSLFGAVGRILSPLKPLQSFLATILRRITPKYFVNSYHEMRKVTWPNRLETWRLTLAVFVFAAVFGTLVAVVDKGLDEIFKKVVLR